MSVNFISSLKSKKDLKNVNKENYGEINNILRTYPRLLEEYDGDTKIDQYIIQLFKEKKTLTSIEIHNFSFKRFILYKNENKNLIIDFN